MLYRLWYKNMMRLGVLIAIMLCISTSLAQGEINDQKIRPAKVVVMDVRYVIENSLAVKTLRYQTKNKHDAIAAALNKKENELKLLESEIKKRKANISGKQFDREVQNFNNKVKEAQKYKQEKYVSLESEHAESMQQVNRRVTKIVKDLSEKYKFNIVIPSSHLFYISPTHDINYDITKVVVKELNQVLP